MIIVGAGIGGLTAALLLATRGVRVTLLERAAAPGGKLRPLTLGGALLDVGPTVFTMRWVFEEIFAEAGADLAAELTLHPAATLARHAWSADARLDLFADIDRAADAIAAFAGPAAGHGYRRFVADARRTWQTLEAPFIRAAHPTPLGLVRAAGFAAMWRTRPFASLWQALGAYFPDPRLRQLFGRYATYCGASPFAAPATLMLVAHVEQDGVWLVEGGMHRLASAIADLAERAGATLRTGAQVDAIDVAHGRAVGVTLAGGERFAADAVICNADAAALAAGRFGTAARHAVPPPPRAGRSLSAVTWAMQARASGFPLLRHNVFFSADTRREFSEVFERRALPTQPTIYVCAQDRPDDDACQPPGDERLLCLVNAPPDGDIRSFTPDEILACEQRVFDHMTRCGLVLEAAPERMVVSTPNDFERLYPATGGGLYGQAVHGPFASFRRPHARTALPGLYLAGGSTHPGAGVPMAALSGRQAAAAVLADRDA